MKLIEEQETKSFLTYTETSTNTRIDVEKRHLEKAVRELENWQTNPMANNFSVLLYNLACKADCENRKKLIQGFPARMTAYLLWYESPNKEEFFEKYTHLTESEDIYE